MGDHPPLETNPGLVPAHTDKVADLHLSDDGADVRRFTDSHRVDLPGELGRIQVSRAHRDVHNSDGRPAGQKRVPGSITA